MKKEHDQKFKEDAVAYYNTHKDLGVKGFFTNLGIG
jgi:transposase